MTDNLVQARPARRRRAIHGMQAVATPGLRQAFPPLTTRVALACDAVAVNRLAQSALQGRPGSRSEPLVRPDPKSLSLDEISAGRVILSECGNLALGMAAIRPLGGDDWEISAQYVAGQRWRSAIAFLLVAHCGDAARRHGGRALHVVGTSRATGFYLACDFRPIGQVQTPWGSANLLQRPLVAA